LLVSDVDYEEQTSIFSHVSHASWKQSVLSNGGKVFSTCKE